MSFFKRFRRAVGASLEAFGPQPYRVRGQRIACPVCAGEEFVRSSGGVYEKPMLLNLNVPWLELDRQATFLICTHCTHILTFGRAPDLDEDGEEV